MATKTWARLDAAVSTTHPLATVLEVTQPLDASLVPGTNIFTKDLVFADVTGIVGVAPGWSTSDGTTFAAPVVPQAAPMTAAQLLAAANTQQDKALAQVWTFNAGTTDAPVELTTMLDATGQSSMNKLASWCLLNAGNSGATEPYSNVDNSPFTLTLPQALSLVTQAGAVFSASIAVLNALSAGIKAAPPTITTLAQITGAAWPTP